MHERWLERYGPVLCFSCGSLLVGVGVVVAVCIEVWVFLFHKKNVGLILYRKAVQVQISMSLHLKGTYFKIFATVIS